MCSCMCALLDERLRLCRARCGMGKPGGAAPPAQGGGGLLGGVGLGVGIG